MNVNQEIMHERDQSLNEMRELQIRLSTLNDKVGLLERQLLCDHEFEMTSDASLFGFYEVHTCKHCGYEVSL